MKDKIGYLITDPENILLQLLITHDHRLVISDQLPYIPVKRDKLKRVTRIKY